MLIPTILTISTTTYCLWQSSCRLYITIYISQKSIFSSLRFTTIFTIQNYSSLLLIASNFFIKKSLCLALELVTSAHSRRGFFVLYEKLLPFDINAFFGKFDFLSFWTFYTSCILFIYETNMNYFLFLVADGKNLKCQKVSILKGIFFSYFIKDHFKLAI